MRRFLCVSGRLDGLVSNVDNCVCDLRSSFSAILRLFAFAGFVCWHLVGIWLALVGIWLAFGGHLVGTWLAFVWHLVAIWLAFGWHVVGIRVASGCLG